MRYSSKIKEILKQQNVAQNDSNNVETQFWGQLLKKAAEFALKKLGPKVTDEVWPAVKSKLMDLYGINHTTEKCTGRH